MGDLGPGPGAGAGDRADQRVVRGICSQGLSRVECGVCLERCPFDVEIIAEMREAAVVLEVDAA